MADPGKFLKIESLRIRICDQSAESSADGCFDEATKLVAGLRDEVEGAGAKFTMMIIPGAFQVDAELTKQVLDHTGHPAARFDLDRPQRYLSE
jgi:hypothetical protein